MIALGPRASLLLGMLIGSPKTVGELVALVDQATNDEDFRELTLEAEAFGGSTFLALRALSDGGSQEIRRQLKRLDRMGLVRSAQLSANTATLWWAT